MDEYEGLMEEIIELRDQVADLVSSLEAELEDGSEKLNFQSGEYTAYKNVLEALNEITGEEL